MRIFAPRGIRSGALFRSPPFPLPRGARLIFGSRITDDIPGPRFTDLAQAKPCFTFFYADLLIKGFGFERFVFS
jgi:hypothetical protein